MSDLYKSGSPIGKQKKRLHQSDFIPNFKYKAKSDLERAMINELCEMAIHKQQVASLLANMYNKNYLCDLSFCLGYTRGGTYLLEAFLWLFEKCTSREIGEVLSNEFVEYVIHLHELKPTQ